MIKNDKITNNRLFYGEMAELAEGARLESGCTLTGTVGSNPTLSAICFISVSFDRARRGGSGALYLQSAIVGLMPNLRVCSVGD